MAQDKTLTKKILERQSQLAEVRRPHEEVTKEIIEMLRPDLTLWDDTDPHSKGQKRNLKIYTAVPIEAVQNATNGLQGNLASKSIDWSRFGLENEELEKVPEIRLWLQEATRGVHRLFSNSNFYSVLNRVVKDGISLSNGPMFIDKSVFSDNLSCSSFHPREIFISENSEGVVNVFHREYEMTIKNAIEAFGQENLSEDLKLKTDTNDQTLVKFIHAIYPADDPILDGEKGLPDRPWISIYIEQANRDTEQKPARIAGYWSKPFMYWRYEKSSDSVYGFGIGASSLVDIFSLNSIARSNMKAAQMAVEPPMMGPLKAKGRIHVKAGGRSWLRAEDIDKVKPLLQNINYPAALDREERVELAINRYFNVDTFLLLNRAEHPISPEELAEKMGEKSILLGPMIGRFEFDLLEPIHDRVFEIAQTYGLIPPPPAILIDSLETARIETLYIGPLAQQQRRLFSTKRTQAAIQAIGPILQVHPEFTDNIDWDKTGKRLMTAEDWPEDEFRSAEDVELIRSQRQKARQAQAVAAMASEVGGMSGAAPEPGSPQAEAMR